ncbi:MAG: ABC transporter permease [Actinobacteria bacterium 13_2_20CM_2_71_6]|nr:MAG: ABC transporter permease [Actinobacteria bacterium 13_2_20CM_2_71_6]
MIRFIVRRLLQMVAAFLGTTLIVYAMTFAAQGDPIQALAGEKPVSAAQRAYLTEHFHLDHTGFGGFWYRYATFLGHLLRGDLGDTLTLRPISSVLAEAWPYTVKLTGIAMVFVVVVGVGAGVLAGVRKGGLFDGATLLLTLVVIGVPVVVLGFLGQYLLGIKLAVFPIANQGTLYSLILPALLLGALSLATTVRLTRTAVAENLRADYAKTARAKGLSRTRVVGVHVLRNSLIPVVTFLGVELGSLMAGAVVIENIFNIPGVGFTLARAVRTDDGPTVVTLVSLLVVIFLFANLVVDLLYTALDPRIRYA